MRKLTVIVINGRGGCGKDTFIRFCRGLLKEKGCRVYNISSISPVKKLARWMGWDGVKDEKGRRFLSDLKKLWTEFNDGPTNYLLGQLSEIEAGLVFFHVREAEEIEKISEAFPGLITLYISRKKIGKIGNRSDDEVESYDYEYRVENDGSLKDLRARAEKLLISLGLL